MTGGVAVRIVQRLPVSPIPFWTQGTATPFTCTSASDAASASGTKAGNWSRGCNDLGYGASLHQATKAFHERFADCLSKKDVCEIVGSKCLPSPGCMA